MGELSTVAVHMGREQPASDEQRRATWIVRAFRSRAGGSFAALSEQELGWLREEMSLVDESMLHESVEVRGLSSSDEEDEPIFGLFDDSDSDVPELGNTRPLQDDEEATRPSNAPPAQGRTAGAKRKAPEASEPASFAEGSLI